MQEKEFRRIIVDPQGNAEIKPMSEEEKNELKAANAAQLKQRGEKSTLAMNEKGEWVLRDSKGNIVAEQKDWDRGKNNEE